MGRHWIVIPSLWGLMALIAASGCGSSSNVESASCSACAGRSFSPSVCESAAMAAGCKSFQYLDTVKGCTNGCSFKDCDSPPECGSGLTQPDAGPMDAMVDPACEGEDGLFPNCDLCPDTCNMVNINGAVQYTCPCGSCPCGFVCGSIPLSVGGVISSVCAPQ